MNLLLGNIYGGETTKAHIIIGNVFEGRVEADVLIGEVDGGEVRTRVRMGGTRTKHPKVG
ncbi:MAG: hypothetical protein ACWGSD_02155 [Thermodesulfobacteriota bacterium]